MKKIIIICILSSLFFGCLNGKSGGDTPNSPPIPKPPAPPTKFEYQKTTVPEFSPFTHKVGIDYQFTSSDTISNEMGAIKKNFQLIHLYHLIYANNGIPKLWDGGKEFIASLQNNVEVNLGTTFADVQSRSDIGYMGKPTYCTNWVKCLIGSFGSVANTKKYIKCISLGNEVNGPDVIVTSANFAEVFKNLKIALSSQGLGTIPVTTSFSNNEASQILPYVKTIVNNWDSGWNSGAPFSFFNFYPKDESNPTIVEIQNFYDRIRKYFNVGNYQKTLGINTGIEIFIGEIGDSDSNQKGNFINNILFSDDGFLGAQYNSKKNVVPTFIFQAFSGQNSPDYRIYTDTSPYTLINKIDIPTWVK